MMKKRKLNLWTLLLMNKILAAAGMACLDCSGSCSYPGVCYTTEKCFSRVDVNGIRYKGCADRWRWRGLDTSYQGCRYQDYLGWNNRRTLWCFCDYNYCNRFPFDEPPQDEIGEPSHRKENLNRNTSGVADREDQDQSYGHRQDDPTADKLPFLTTQGTDFTATIPSNREESNKDQGRRFSDGPEDKRYVSDQTGRTGRGRGGGSDGSPNRHQIYTNVNTEATTQRIRPEWFMTPRYPSPWRGWVPYTQSTAMPKGVTRGKDMRRTPGSSTERYDVILNRDGVRTGLETNERNGYVSDRNLTDGNQGNDNTPEARAWTGPIPHNLHTKQTTSIRRHPSPMPPDTFSTMSPNETKSPDNKTTGSLPPLAPLTKWSTVTTRKPKERTYNPYTPRGNGSYTGIHNENHGDGYHHDGDMEQYYRDYHGDQEIPENTSNRGYMRPEEKQAPVHENYGTDDKQGSLNPASGIQNDPSAVTGFKDPENPGTSSLAVNRKGTPTDPGECPPDFENVSQFESCYLFIHTPVTHQDALSYCRDTFQRSHLVSIETKEEYIFLKGRASMERKLLQGWQGWWTGGIYNPKIREFIWYTTGRVISKLDSRWRRPLLLRPYAKTCVWLVPLSGLPFGNFFCNQKTGFICEIDYPVS